MAILDINIIIQKYLTGEASNSELEHLLEWIEKDPIHRNEFLEIKDVWDSSQAVFIRQKIDKKKAFKAFLNRIQDEEKIETEIKIEPTNKGFSLYKLIAAASILLIVTFTTRYFLTNSEKEQLIYNSLSTPLIDTLVDESVIVLAVKTQVIKQANYNKTNRVVNLNGKAYFSVKKNNNLPFIVYTPNLIIEVTGTSFLINTQFETNKEEIIVETGQIKLTSRNNIDSSFFVNRGERIIFSSSDNSIFKIPNKKNNFNSWYTGKLLFDNTPLSIVFSELEEFYSISIEFDVQQFENLKFTARLGNQPLVRVLETIEMVYNVKFEELTDKNYSIKPAN